MDHHTNSSQPTIDHAGLKKGHNFKIHTLSNWELMRLGNIPRSWIALSFIAPVRARYLGSKNTLPVGFHTCTSFRSRSLLRDRNTRWITTAKMSPELVDVDCNLWHRDLKSLQNKEEEEGGPWTILSEDAIKNANIVAMLSPSSTVKEAENGLSLLKSNPPPLPVKTTVGVHPYHVNDDEFSGKSLEEHGLIMKELLQSYPNFCAAVGECGLDSSDGFPPLQDQLPWFRLQVEIARELDLPIFVHERLAFDETMDILKDVSVPIIIHCFTGTKEQCVEYIKKGYHVSISGFILKESNDNCAEVISCLQEGVIPLERLMIETDAPYMGFSNCRQLYMEHNEEYVSGLNAKKRKRLQQSMYPNVPSSLPLVLDKVVECLQKHDSTLTREQVAEQTTKNAKQFFGL